MESEKQDNPTLAEVQLQRNEREYEIVLARRWAEIHRRAKEIDRWYYGVYLKDKGGLR